MEERKFNPRKRKLPRGGGDVVLTVKRKGQHTTVERGKGYQMRNAFLRTPARTNFSAGDHRNLRGGGGRVGVPKRRGKSKKKYGEGNVLDVLRGLKVMG